MQKAHLHTRETNDSNDIRGEVTFEDFTDPCKLTYTHRSRCWSKPTTEVNAMIQSIQKDELNPPVLILSGSDSRFAEDGEESCITWAKKKLVIAGVNIEDCWLESLVTITTNYTPIQNDD